MKQGKVLVIVSILLISVVGLASAGNRVFFYEDKAAHKIDSDYSTFKEELERKGYNILRAEVPLSKTVIEDYNPDVIIIPGLNNQLEANELNAIAKFVIQDGKGLFIVGGSQYVNQLLPFGIVVDDVELEDLTDPIVDAGTREPGKNRNEFVIKAPFSREDSTVKTLLYKVYEIGFFGGNGIYVSGGSTKPILEGDWDTSTSTGSFPPGSKPTVAIAARVGKGIIFFISDDSILDNTHLDTEKYKYDNLQLGMNVVEWLSLPSEIPDDVGIEDLRIMIGEMKLGKEKINETLAKTQSEVETLSSQNRVLAIQLQETEGEVERLETSYFLQQWSITYSTIIVLVIFLVLVSAQRALMGKGKKMADEEDVGDLGYEFEEEPEEGELDLGEGEMETAEEGEGELDLGEDLPDIEEESAPDQGKKDAEKKKK